MTLNNTIAITNDNDYDQHSNTRAGNSEVGPASTTTTTPTPTQAQLLTNYCDHRPRSFQVINDADCNDASTSDTDNSRPDESYNGHNDLDDMATTVSQQLWTSINKNNHANTNDYDRQPAAMTQTTQRQPQQRWPQQLNDTLHNNNTTTTASATCRRLQKQHINTSIDT
ncbi:hypothetical protein EDB83DRAFT_2535356 [Lactarius deliciosus]|nr:hypothetical protein EDB83DRAFT_2535356 [Lactarius deliciosus]